MLQETVPPANSGFEETAGGKPTRWIAYNGQQIYASVTEQVYAGTYSVKLTNPSSSAGLRSVKVPVTPGTSYRASVMSYNADTNSQLYLEFWDSSNTRITPVSIKTNSTRGEWSRMEIEQTAPSNAAYATLLLYLSSANTGTAYYDEAYFGLAKLPPNPGFELVADGKPTQWIAYNAQQQYESATDQVYAGTYSVKLTNPSSSAGLRSVKIPVVPGTVYEASVKSYNVDKGSELYLEFWNSSNQRITPVSTKANKTIGGWADIRIRQQAPANAATATLLLYLGSANTGTAYFDEASFGLAPAEQAEFDHLAVNISKTLYEVGDTGAIRWYGLKTDGSLLDASTVSQVTYESKTPGVIAIHPTTGSFQALAPGSSVIQVKATSDGVTRTSRITLRADNFSGPISGSKTESTFYTAAKRANIASNIAQYGWAQAQRDAAVTNAAPYLAINDERLWSIVTPQSVSRSLGIATRYLITQKPSPDPDDSTIRDFGNYPWKIDVLNHPWKLQSPVTGRFFPTNDFASFYASGLDAHGMFDYELAMRNGSAYLTNTQNPGSTWGIDDGWGWPDENGDIWTFIAYYNHWGIWYNGFIMKALNSLRDAYLFTGNAEYAFKGLLLLDRVADVYPDLDVTAYPWGKGFDNGDPSGHSAQGKAVNDIWETGLAKALLYAYDAFFPAMDGLEQRLAVFLSAKAQAYDMANPKHTVGAIRKNIEDGIVRVVYPGVRESQIRGNMGMHQSALALAAVVLDEPGTSKDWLDFVFQSGDLIRVTDPDAPYGRQYRVTGGDMSRLLVDEVDQDGMGNEAAPGYNAGWLRNFLETAEVLDGYERYPEYDLYQNVKFRKMFFSHFQLTQLGKYTPSIGDSGLLGSPGVIGDISQDILAFEHWGDPELGQLIYMKNGNSTDGLHGSIFSSDPERTGADIADIIAAQGELTLDSTVMNGYGFAALRDGTPRSRPGGTVYAFKDLPIVSANRGTKYLTNYGALLFQNLDGAGAEITFEFDVPADRHYEIAMLPNKAPSYGQYAYSIDGQPVGTYDFYGGSAPTAFSVLDERELTAGTHTLTFAYAGKAPESTGHYAAFKELALLTPEQREQWNYAELDTQRSVWMYYGRNGGHGHRDTLNLGGHAYGMDLAPDLGYPDITGNDPKRVEWTSNTIAHNTVVVDQSKQRNSIIGLPLHFDGGGKVKLFDVEAPKAYPDTDLYRRTTALIRADREQSYAVDFFRVEGGSSHTFSFHGADADVTSEGLQLVPQQDGSGQYVGTYAGANVPYGQKEPGSGSGGSYMGSGFHYLYDVDRAAAPQAPFSVDWKVKDTWNVYDQDPDVHLRLTMLNPVDEVALASGKPPQMNANSPESVRYMVASRSGANLASTFVSVIEPYKDNRIIESIASVQIKNGATVVQNNSIQAVKVELTDGRTDYIIYSLDPNTTYTIDGRLQFQGFFGVYSERNGLFDYAYTHDGRLLGLSGSAVIDEPHGRLSGTVVDFTRELSPHNQIVAEMNLHGVQPETLVGRMLVADNDAVRNGAYTIKGVTALGSSRYALDIGDITPIRAYVDANDFEQGFVYNIAAQSAFYIALTHERASLSSVKLGGLAATPMADTTQQAVVTATYGDDRTVDVTPWASYSSTNPSIAKVSSTGLVTFKKAGTTVIQATYGGKQSAPLSLQVQ
ncbi:Ig-like domain-containing protein [Paenibacillus hemerocallicola]|nr:Ig-like domain-containing protein [Paenibacillus hemerocallicola]